MKILHITDFHIDASNGDNENLREGYYHEFIDNLFNLINQHGLSEINLVVNTGDFINQGKIENYPHAKCIIDKVLSKAKLNKSDIAVCIGNHDFKMKESGTLAEKIKPFEEFSIDLQPGKFISEVERAKLYSRIDDNVQILIIDNASREDNVNEPVNLSTQQLDLIIGLCRNSVVDAKNLIVLSHYPMLLFPMSKYASEGDDWTKSHVWKNGFVIQHRLAALRPNGETMFLCGDGHIPDAFQNENKTFVMTGNLGGDYTKNSRVTGGKTKSYQNYTQARIIEFGNNQPQVYTFNYKPSGYEFDSQMGEWSYEASTLREVINKQGSEETNPIISRTQVLSRVVQDQIINRVQNENLYKIGRFITSPDVNSLSWISINRLFEDLQIFVGVVDKSVEWLDSFINDKANCVIVGVDFFGAMIGTQVAARLGTKIECVSSRVSYLVENPLDHFIAELNGINDLKDIVFITDVISSGNSLISLISKIESAYLSLTSNNLPARLHSISILSDVEIPREDFEAKMTSIKTACGALRMPIVDSKGLPSTDILPSQIDLTS